MCINQFQYNGKPVYKAYCHTVRCIRYQVAQPHRSPSCCSESGSSTHVGLRGGDNRRTHSAKLDSEAGAPQLSAGPQWLAIPRCHGSASATSASVTTSSLPYGPTGGTSLATAGEHLCGPINLGRRRWPRAGQPTAPTCALTRAGTTYATASVMSLVAFAALAPTAPTAVVSVGPALPPVFRVQSRAHRRLRSASPPS